MSLEKSQDSRQLVFNSTDEYSEDSSPPSYADSRPPPAGNRIPLTTFQAVGSLSRLGPTPLYDLQGEPVFVCSAILGDSVVSSLTIFCIDGDIVLNRYL